MTNVDWGIDELKARILQHAVRSMLNRSSVMGPHTLLALDMHTINGVTDSI
jgi:hypothetical protein